MWLHLWPTSIQKFSSLAQLSDLLYSHYCSQLHVHYLMVTNLSYITCLHFNFQNLYPHTWYKNTNFSMANGSVTLIHTYIHFLLLNVTSVNRFTVNFKHESQPISYIIRSYESTLPFRCLYWFTIEVPFSWSSLVLKFHIKNKFLSFHNCCVFKFLVESVSIWNLKYSLHTVQFLQHLINHVHNTYTE